MDGWITPLVLLAAAAGTSHPSLAPRAAPQPKLVLTISNMTATPGTISFQAIDPDLGAVPGTPAASVTWNAIGLIPSSWTLTVQAPSASFSGCPSIPVSAVTVTCTGVSVGGNGSGTCSGSVPLSTSPQKIAGGTEAFLSAGYAVNLSFTLTDSWKYVAQMSPLCSITVTYTANLN